MQIFKELKLHHHLYHHQQKKLSEIVKMCCKSNGGAKWKKCSSYPMAKGIQQSHYIITILTLILLVIIQMQMVSAGVGDSLMGHLESCSNEGEEIQLKIKNSKCYKCSCQNGLVNCYNSCPSTDDCFLLDSKSGDTCCRRCKGCTFRGVPYESGAEWTDPEDPCKTYKCIASVVTETIQKCYSQCDDNQMMPPRPGECCPTCQSCKINGQTVAEGQEVVASIDDRCLLCQCNENKLSCAKKTCPILQCPKTKQKQHPNECCPRCTEHRELVPVIGKCIFNKDVYYDKTQFTPDRCTNCTCVNGTSICQRATCPILECSPEFQEDDGCCPRCVVAEVRSECTHQGITYANNETWNMGPCRSCRCNGGTIRCSEMRCPQVKCRGNEELKVPPGECCPKCLETAGTCTVFGDPHFKTFDGKFFSFQGSCKYLLAADCLNHNFSIRLTNDGRGTKRSSWPKTVTLKLGNLRINLGQKLRVKVNGTRVLLPYVNDAVTIERLPEGGIMLRSKLGLAIEWDGSNNFLQISVPAHYKHRLCGLCGNYNGSVRDDLTGRDGRQHGDNEVWHFANSWKVGGLKSCSRPREHRNVAATLTCNKRKSSFYCRPLSQSSVFGKCDNRVNPDNYIESCRMDVCECPSGNCHCDSFAAYAHECRRLGINLPDWRTDTNCPAAGGWRRNVTIAQFRGNHLYGDPDFGGLKARRRKQQQQQQQQQQHQQQQLHRRQQHQHNNNNHQQNQLLDNEFIKKHVPHSLLQPRAPDRTPPPLH
ncbi:BMP-binding endothelial regulator protein [Drosophila tropicalis]|uniref:BMP-binding endothelial regulator protein n=1 Tax=Drosophila tropicalis TaxID=46794 RepID=UPI0035ABE3F0